MNNVVDEIFVEVPTNRKATCDTLLKVGMGLCQTYLWPNSNIDSNVLVTTQVQALDPIRTSNLLKSGTDWNTSTHPCQPK